MKYLLMGMVVLSCVGCASLARVEERVREYTDNTIPSIGEALDPVTNGWGSILAGAIGTSSAGIFAFNRMLLAKKRGEALAEVHKNPETPSLVDQVSTVAAKKVVAQLIKAGLEAS